MHYLSWHKIQEVLSLKSVHKHSKEKFIVQTLADITALRFGHGCLELLRNKDKQRFPGQLKATG